jgi:hypothetical protein
MQHAEVARIGQPHRVIEKIADRLEQAIGPEAPGARRGMIMRGRPRRATSTIIEALSPVTMKASAKPRRPR